MPPQNAPMSEIPPGQQTNPQISEALAQFTKYVQQVLGARGAVAPTGGGGTPAQVPQMTPSAPPPVVAGGSPGQGGVPTPQAGITPMAPPQESQMARTNPSFNYPTSQARDAATASSALSGISGAIANIKAKKNADLVTKAQNTMNMFNTALQGGDMQTANIIADKHYKDWEKYLKLEFDKVPGRMDAPQESPMGVGAVPQPKAPAGALAPINTPGGLAVPRQMPGVMSPLDAAKIAEQQALAEEHRAGASAKGAEQAHWQAQAGLAGVEMTTKVIDAMSNLQAKGAEADAAKVRLDEAKAKLDAQPLENAKLRAEATKDYADAIKALADAEKARKEAGVAKNLAGYNAAESHFKTILSGTSTELQELRSRQDRARGSLAKAWGGVEDTPEMKDKSALLKAHSQAYKTLTGLQQKVVDGTMNIEDAQYKARSVARLTPEFGLGWAGAPPNAPAAPPVDGATLKDTTGEVVAISKGGAWADPGGR